MENVCQYFILIFIVFLFLGGETGIELEMKEKPNDMPLIKHKEVEYLGMFEYKKEDEPIIIKNLIYGKYRFNSYWL